MAKKSKKQNTPKKKPEAAGLVNAAKRGIGNANRRLQEHRQTSPHRSFRLSRRSETPDYQRVPVWWRLVGRTLRLLRREWKKITPLILLFALIAWLVSGIFNQGFTDIKLALDLFNQSDLSFAEEALVLFSGFVTAQASNIPQDSLIVLNILGLLLWLSFIWIARYSLARKATIMREALYTSGAALIPFVALLVLLVVQLLPATLAGLIFSNMTGGGFTQSTLEAASFITLGLLLIVLSIYFIIGTLVALQVVALPGMYPWRALRNARKLVMNRRFSVLRKVAILPFIVLVAWALLFIPILLLDNAICSGSTSCWSTITILPLAYFILVGLTVAFLSIYLYVMYRALLEQEDNYI